VREGQRVELPAETGCFERVFEIARNRDLPRRVVAVELDRENVTVADASRVADLLVEAEEYLPP
jgi:hypothetical protein